MVGIEHDEQGLFRDAVRSVRLLRITVPQLLLAKWHWGEFGIGANGSGLDKFSNLREPGLLDQVQSHRQVGEKEPAGLLQIGADATDFRGEMNHHIGPRLAKQSADLQLIRQIVLGTPRHDQPVGADAALLKHLANDPPQKAGAAGHADAIGRPIEHR